VHSNGKESKGTTHVTQLRVGDHCAVAAEVLLERFQHLLVVEALLKSLNVVPTEKSNKPQRGSWLPASLGLQQYWR
jgi:hypothetical protein